MNKEVSNLFFVLFTKKNPIDKKKAPDQKMDRGFTARCQTGCWYRPYLLITHKNARVLRK